MSTLENLFLSQLRTLFVCEAKPENKIDVPCPEVFSELLRLSTRHSVTPLIAESLSRHGFLTEEDVAESYRHISYRSFIKWQQQEIELQKVTALFETHYIHYMPLKGAVLRNFYPEAWMRTSCDIDILVQEEQLSAARKVLIEELGYREDNKTDHDVMLIAPNGVQLELHYDFSEKQVSTSDVWATAHHNEGSYRYEMSPEWFYLHHLAHMAKHFVLGGCGIRTFIDLWLMKKNMPYDEERLNEMLRQCELLLFAENMLALVSDWMAGKDLTDIQKQILEFVLTGGTYGVLDNRVAVSHSRKQNFLLYVFTRVFPNYKAMVYLYPILRKHRILMPFCQVHRWFHLLNRDKLKKAETELKNVQALDNDKLDDVSDLLAKLGI
ncbi:MAG: hypothetical protein E7400_03170 [Ruminococcaceae bacterium]|nr:hypothetical protein [Oscillospiraceae bacterium]